jgi:hypothetical protein
MVPFTLSFGRGSAHAGFSAATLLAFASFAHSASAEEAVPRFGLAWVRDAGAGSCLDQRSLKIAVQNRLGREPFSDDAERTIEGNVSRSARSFKVTLRVRDASGAEHGERHLELETDDCSKLSEAVVLAVALTIDPNAPATAETRAAPEIPSTSATAAPPSVGLPLSSAPQRAEPHRVVQRVNCTLLGFRCRPLCAAPLASAFCRVLRPGPL